MIKSKKQMFIIMSVFALILFLGGITYSWFTYRRETGEQELIAGEIYLHLNEGQEEISMSNLFPETPEEARARNDNYITFTIDGKNTSTKKVYYELILNHGTDKASPKSRYRDEDLRFDLVEIDSNGDEVEYILNDVGYDTLVNRRIWVDTVDANTTTELVRRYKLRMWLSEDVIISDTDLNKTYTAAEYPNKYATIKLTVAGDFEEKTIEAYYEMKKNAVVNTNINFKNSSASNNGNGIFILTGTENDQYPIYYFRGNIDYNNVIFGGFCWQMIRSTETGGIKMVYNGEVTDNGTTCTNTLHADRILSNTSRFNYDTSSLANVGYMLNAIYNRGYISDQSGSIYGKDIEWDGTNYLVIDDTPHTPSISTEKSNDRHYSCGTTGVTSCNQVRFYYSTENYYITLSSGDLLEDAIYKMTGNGSDAIKAKYSNYNLNANNSVIKDTVDNWFRMYLTNEVDSSNPNYVDYLEDTVYCNDRSFKTIGGYTFLNSGWNPNGGNLSYLLFFGATNRYNNNWYSKVNIPTVKNEGVAPYSECPNKLDRFTVSESIGNGALTYPVGLLTADEVTLAGGGTGGNGVYYLYTGGDYWTMTPEKLDNAGSRNFFIREYGDLITDMSYSTKGVRPVISLKHSIKFELGGDGTPTNPYVVIYN